MATKIEDIKFGIKFTGADKVEKALKSIQEATDKVYNSFKKLEDITKNFGNSQDRIADKVINDNKKLSDSFKKLSDDVKASSKAMADSQIQQTRRANDQIGKQNGGNNRGNMYRTRYAFAAMGSAFGMMNLPGGNILSSAASMGGAGMMVGGPLGAAGGVAIGAAMGVFGEGVNIFKEAAGDLASTVMQIGGWRGIQASIVETANAQQRAVQNVNISSNTGGISGAQNLQNLMGMSSNFGIDLDEVVKAQSEFVKLTGNLPAFNAQFSMFAKMAIASGTPIEEVAKSMATLKEQFQDLDENQFKKLELAAYGLSKFGEISFDKIIQLSKATGTGAFMSGGAEGEMAAFMTWNAVGQKTAANMGGGRRFATAAQKFVGMDFGGKLSPLGIGSYGGAPIGNLDKDLLKAAAALKSGRLTQSGISVGLPVEMLLGQIGTHMTGKNEKEMVASGQEWIDNIKKQIETEDQLNEEYKKVTDTVQYRLHKAFIELSNKIGTFALDKLEKEVVPAIEKFIKVLEDNEPELKKTVESLSQMFKELLIITINWAPLLADVAVASAYVLKGFIGLIEWITTLLPSALIEKLGLKVAGVDLDKMFKDANNGADKLISSTKRLDALITTISTDLGKMDFSGTAGSVTPITPNLSAMSPAQALEYAKTGKLPTNTSDTANTDNINFSEVYKQQKDTTIHLNNAAQKLDDAATKINDAAAHLPNK